MFMLSRKFLLPLIRCYSTNTVKWEPWEDKMIVDFVKHNGRKWTALSQHCLPHRSRNQCQMRWDVVNPDYKQGPFNLNETKSLQKGLEKHGNNWAAIQEEFLPHRAPRRLSLEHRNKSSQPWKKWTDEEDKLLLKGVAEFGPKYWTKIANKYLPQRQPTQLAYRYKEIINPNLKTNKKLSQEELDTILKRTIIFGHNWKKVAEGLPGRTPDRCAKAWMSELDPSLNKGSWCPEEERLLWELLYRLDGSFHKAAEYLPGRSRILCNRKFTSKMRTLQLLLPEETQKTEHENSPGWVKRMAGIMREMEDKKTDLRIESNGALVLHQSVSWTKEESDNLKQLAESKLNSNVQLTKLDWEEIASHFDHHNTDQCKHHYVTHLKNSNRKRGSWSEEEDELLIQLVAKYGTRWSHIAEKMTNRNPQQCSYRWHRVLKQSKVITGVRLNDEEKQLIKEGVLMFGNNWNAISATYLPHRTPYQCMRWWNFQRQKNRTVDDEDISIKTEKDRWTDDQDKTLSFLVSGYKGDGDIAWNKVASMIPGRSATQCKVRWLYSLMPNLNTRWTYEEEMQLVEIVQKIKSTNLRNIWPTVAAHLNTGRNEWQCRRKFDYMQRTGNRFAV